MSIINNEKTAIFQFQHKGVLSILSILIDRSYLRLLCIILIKKCNFEDVIFYSNDDDDIPWPILNLYGGL